MFQQQRFEERKCGRGGRLAFCWGFEPGMTPRIYCCTNHHILVDEIRRVVVHIDDDFAVRISCDMVLQEWSGRVSKQDLGQERYPYMSVVTTRLLPEHNIKSELLN